MIQACDSSDYNLDSDLFIMAIDKALRRLSDPLRKPGLTEVARVDSGAPLTAKID